MRKVYYDKISEISKNVISMGNLASDAVLYSVKALLDSDPVMAQKVIDTDYKIDDYEILIEEKCIVLQAKHQPVATDLRYIHSISNIIIHLERIGDLSVNIAKIARNLSNLEIQYLDREMKELLQEMSNFVKSALNKAIKAFEKNDFKLASEIDKIDNAIDDIQKTIVKKLYHSVFNKKENINIIADLFLVARYLERIGDHSVSIGERVQYYLTGDYTVFHSDA
ncbi:MAG: phosphate signaling complex protein PhoU [Actinomycetota bacterium]|jgi:phosphate transport system protein|nr:phosphate signaling complex protein PhoU [Actinomycetota bacterium]